MHLSHHRPHIQHCVNTLSRSMRSPTVIAMRRLKKFTRYLLGTSEVYQELCPDPHAEKRCKCQSTAIGLTTEKLVKAAVEEHFSFTDWKCSRGHAHKRGRVVRHWLRSCRRFGSSTSFEKMAVRNSTVTSDGLTESALAVCK